MDTCSRGWRRTENGKESLEPSIGSRQTHRLQCRLRSLVRPVWAVKSILFSRPTDHFAQLVTSLSAIGAKIGRRFVARVWKKRQVDTYGALIAGLCRLRTAGCDGLVNFLSHVLSIDGADTKNPVALLCARCLLSRNAISDLDSRVPGPGSKDAP